MKTKYIKVKVSDRLPSEVGYYITDGCKMFFSNDESSKKHWINCVEYWFEEVPDYEDEAVDLLKKMIINIKDVFNGDYSPFYIRSCMDKSQSLLQKVTDKK